MKVRRLILEARVADMFGSDDKFRKFNMTRPPKHMLNPFKCQDAAPPEKWNEVYADL